jgi:hypothetical protein
VPAAAVPTAASLAAFGASVPPKTDAGLRGRRESSPDLALRRRFLAAGSERTALPRRLRSWYFSQVIWF